jgi:DNA-binding transcriptional regulator YdaS (Cro superfamily)
MANENLKNALQDAGLTAEQFAEIIAVDPKTVQRWVSGRTPYPKHRVTVARALDLSEHALWPDDVPAPTATATPPTVTATPPTVTATPPTATATPPAAPDADDGANEVVRSWGGRADPRIVEMRELFPSARHEIDLLDAGGSLLAQPQMIAKLCQSADLGLRVRVLTASDVLGIESLARHPGVQLRVSDTPLAHSLVRADQTTFFAIWLAAQDTMPTFQLQRRRDHGLFDRLQEHFDTLWDTSDPVDESQTTDTGLSAGDDPNLPSTEPTSGRLSQGRSAPIPADPPRRWPRS